MKVMQKRYFVGPNVHAPSAGLWAEIGWVAGQLPAPTWHPDARSYPDALACLREVLPTGLAGETEIGREAVIERVANATPPLAEHLLHVASALVEDFCAAPETGSVLEVGATGVTIFLPCESARLAEPALQLAMRSLMLIAQPAPPQALKDDLAQAYRAFRRLAAPIGLSMRHILLARAAHRRGIPCYRIPGSGRLFQFGQGVSARRISEMLTDRTGCAPESLTRDKFAVNRMLSLLGIPTPDTQPAKDADTAVRLAKAMGGAVVVKPRSSSKGRGVCIDLHDEAAIRRAFDYAAGFGAVVIERMLIGQDYRALLVEGRLEAVAQRVPARVIGDGQRSVRELVAALNHGRRRRLDWEGSLVAVEMDEEARRVLAEQGLGEESVVPAGTEALLRRVANISRGGTAIDVTDRIHPDNRVLLERVARVIGVDVMGVDFIIPDIGRSWRAVPSALIEVNAQPGFNPHQGSDPPRDVATSIMEAMFPGNENGRVPTIGVLGGSLATDIAEEATTQLSASGRVVAKISASGAAVADAAWTPRKDESAREPWTLFLDPAGQAAVFEVAPRAVLETGLGIDACEIVVLAGVASLADKGLDRGQRARVAAVLAGCALRRVVLDADDDEGLAACANLALDRVCLVSPSSDHPALRQHLASGGSIAGSRRTASGVLEVCLERAGAAPVQSHLADREQSTLLATTAVLALLQESDS